MSRPIATNYRSVTPYLAIQGVTEALEFYQKAFGAIAGPICLRDLAGKVVHAEILIGDSIVMLSEESLEWAAPSPLRLGGTPVKICLTVDDVDAFVARAVEAGATLIVPVHDQFYGERSGRLADPFGHLRIVGTPIEKVSPDEMQRRLNAMYAEAAK